MSYGPLVYQDIVTMSRTNLVHVLREGITFQQSKDLYTSFNMSKGFFKNFRKNREVAFQAPNSSACRQHIADDKTNMCPGPHDFRENNIAKLRKSVNNNCISAKKCGKKHNFKDLIFLGEPTGNGHSLVIKGETPYQYV